jgi:mercuric ion binding protein
MRFLKAMLISGALVAGLTGLASAKEVTAQIPVSGMTCGACAVAVKKALISVEGVKKADVSLEQKRATVIYEDSQVTEKQLQDAINKSGFKAETAKQDGK